MDLMRPSCLKDFVGQAAIVEDVHIALLAAEKRRAAGMPWAGELATVATGDVGLGKTTLAYVIACEFGIHFFSVSGGSLDSAEAVRSWLYRLASDRSGPYLMLCDESDAMAPAASQEFLFPLAEGHYVEDDGERMDLRDTIFYFASNRLSALSPALISRCALRFQFQPYTEDQLATIALNSADRQGYQLDGDAALLLASYAQNEARAVNMLLKTVITNLVAQNGNGPRLIGRDIVEPILTRRLYPGGVTQTQRDILEFLSRRPKGKAGLRTLSSAVGQDPRDVERYFEKWLVRQGMVTVETSGRAITAKGRAYLAAMGSPSPSSLLSSPPTPPSRIIVASH